MRDKPLTPVRAIRLWCLECEGGAKGVRLCSTDSCPLHTYRFGTNPRRRGIGGIRCHSTSKIPTQVGILDDNTGEGRAIGELLKSIK